MLAGIEFIVAAAAIALGIGLFVVALRKRPAVAVLRNSEESTGDILQANLFSLGVIALMFFGLGFLVDAFM